ncbi:putative alpha/beta hydrolase [Acinetobacter calcoaceticus]|uniref:Putative alpha/beta hydrolase n=1 Tax=Acinetobacter calcoaceticus TaxID=471 RepID=A0A4V2R1F0_ACICA|nr:putative alpha/beta hydrolase [Acinetobacter calcoaceticus]
MPLMQVSQSLIDFQGRTQIPVDLYLHPDAKTLEQQPDVIILPALGVPISKYQALIECLLAQGFNVIAADYPGCGRNQPLVSATFDYGYADLLTDFIPALIAQIPSTSQQAPLLFGHSLGGHLATLYALNHQVQVVGVATGNIGLANWDLKGKLNILTAVLSFKALLWKYGYLPGAKIGFGHQEAKTLMQDWCKTVLTGHYQHIVATETASDHPALFIHLHQDQWAPLSTTLALSRYFSHPQVEQLDLSLQIKGNQHSVWIKQPQAIVSCMQNYLKMNKYR